MVRARALRSGQIVPGLNYKVTGKTPAADWWQIESDDGNGWAISQLATTNGDGNAVAVVEKPQALAAPWPLRRHRKKPRRLQRLRRSSPWRRSHGERVAPAPVAPRTGGGSSAMAFRAMVDNGQIFPCWILIGGLGFNWFQTTDRVEAI